MRVIATKVHWLKKKDVWRKKRQPKNTSGSKKRPPMKKVATLKRKGLKKKDIR
jgi:hypothetical protein